MNRGMGFLCEARVSDIAMSAYVPRELATEAYLHAANLYSGRLVEVLTMMQSCASAAKLRAAGPIFRSASEPVRITASRHSDRQFGGAPKSQRERRIAQW
jgi:hypothetical protein